DHDGAGRTGLIARSLGADRHIDRPLHQGDAEHAEKEPKINPALKARWSQSKNSFSSASVIGPGRIMRGRSAPRSTTVDPISPLLGPSSRIKGTLRPI